VSQEPESEGRPTYAPAVISAARRVRGLAMVVLLISAGCGDSGGTGATSPTEDPSFTQTPSSSPATCDEPEATTIELVASNVRFDVTCLVVPAGEPLDVTLRNEENVNHNFSIYTREFASEFTGEIAFGGETFQYDVPALEPGEYLFQCDFHPGDMEGPLIVR
jgi:plastocyanin